MDRILRCSMWKILRLFEFKKKRRVRGWVEARGSAS